MSMNDDIWACPRDFPAVTEVDRHAIGAAAGMAANQLKRDRFAYVALEPDDGTRYEFSIVFVGGKHADPLALGGAPFRFANSFGTLYPWMGTPTVHPDYAAEHYVSDDSPWTATVIALFLNSVAEAMGND